MSSGSSNKLYVTNDYSVLSKYSAVKTGYSSDEILKDFVEKWIKVKSWRRAPLVNRGYAARMLAMDWIIDRAIKFESIDCFIVLGAGYDTSALKRLHCCRWIEIDLPQVVTQKREFICDRKLLDGYGLIKLDSSVFSSKSHEYQLIACDLCDIPELDRTLRIALEGLDRIRNVAILNEVCLCYQDIERVEKILGVMIELLRVLALRVHYIGYEQIRPAGSSQFARFMSNHFVTLGYPLKYFPTSEQIRALLGERLKLNHITISSMFQIFHNALRYHTLAVEAFQREPFDEYEEMDLYLSHYAVVTGVLIVKDPFLADVATENSSNYLGEVDTKLGQINFEQCGQLSYATSSVRRFGHASCKLGNNGTILVTGGFGIDEATQSSPDRHQHKRLSDCVVLPIDKSSSDTSHLDVGSLSSTSVCLDRMHGQVVEVIPGVVFFNGGRQSPARHNPRNVSFLAAITDSRLEMRHQFEDPYRYTRWRHKLSQIDNDQFVQVGGLSSCSELNSLSSLVVWNLSSSKLGFTCISAESTKPLDRHSFAMDVKDRNTLLIYGGLQGSEDTKDKSINGKLSTLLWDVREGKPSYLGESLGAFYGSNVHFVSEHRFVQLGGLCSVTGLECDAIRVIDLRNSRETFIEQKLSPERPMILTNATTCISECDRKIISIGGGGCYFTFGTLFNGSHLIYSF